MFLRRVFLASALLFSAVCAPAHALDATKPTTESGKAWATVRKAVRQGDVVSVELRFETDYEGYSGETIYEKPADDAIYLTAGGKRFPLLQEDGKLAAPAELKLKFNYDPGKNPRVGDWKARFSAPPADAADVMLTLPKVAPIGPITIREQ
ncbi:MAG: hypothetical protein ACOYJQ_07445 [Pseudochelatococcus sp.]|jgi:hypothetical protein|uniref:hypothetical protein n=1 Tax=Pseudochelatococcus sp. TaxID=2020869 RepID=UPI003D8B3512